MTDTPAATYRRDYRPPAFLVERVSLRFDLDPQSTTVAARLTLRRNPAHGDATAPLRLDGDDLALVSLSLDGAAIDSQRYSRDATGLTVADMPDTATLEVVTRIDPSANSELSGLYVSGGNFFTQCEAEGFRRITYFPDRPDVMAVYDVTLVATEAACPVLLSNGNPVEQGRLPDGRHFARWDDPHPKPSYLFALVAGQLEPVRDRFTTQSGRDVALAIWVRDGDQDRCGHAMDSLKRAMRWDEEVFGLEYDLDVFNIAAVSDFNMGAMENKGLNIFNTSYVLAQPQTATDGDLQNVERVIAHEYFHNWTGNRITCRDWFQLSLKEGLTVFRDQQFSADQGSAAVKRIADIRTLRAAQFAEDDGPMAHPVRPDKYVAIDNFYTTTVYEKGAEVVRMMYHHLGPAGFRRGMDTYVARHDNQAVTLEDFVAALSDGGGRDCSPFLAWYDQAGTPVVTAEGHHDAAARRYTLSLRQQTPPTPGQPTKHPVPIPVPIGLISSAGEQVASADVLLVDESQTIVFEGIAEPPVPSLLRGLSAPVKLRGLTRDQLRHLAAYDTDPVSRWDSLQEYSVLLMLDRIAARASGEPVSGDAGLSAAWAAALQAAPADPALAALCLMLPSESVVAGRLAIEDPDGVHAVREALRLDLARALAPAWQSMFESLADIDPAAIDGASMGRRALRNVCLRMLAVAAADGIGPAWAQFERAEAAGSMTDTLAAMEVLAASEDPRREQALARFHDRWRNDELVLDKWFSIQAASPRPDTLAVVRELWRHPDFVLRPNRCRALLGSFASGNPVRFHAPDGSGYSFLADSLLVIDRQNGQLAARMVSAFSRWHRHDATRAAAQQQALQRIAAASPSRFTAERVALALGQSA